MPVAAVVASAVVGVGSAVASSNAQKSAAKSAANATTKANDANVALAREERARNEALFAPYLQDENRAKAYADALSFGSGTYPGPNGQTITITRAQVEQEIANTPLAQLAETSYAERETLADQSYADETGQAQSAYTGARDIAERDLGARNDEASRARTDRETTAANARTGLRAVGDENYANTLTLAEQDYLKRQGFTDAEISAWEAKALDAKNDAINAAASRLGVSGQTGRTTRTIGDVEQSYAMDRALYEGGRRREDYDIYADTRLDADAERGRVYLNAEGYYVDAMGRAVDTYAGDRASAYDQFSDADTAAYGDLSEAQRQALLRRNSTRAANTDARTGDKASSYAAFAEDLSGRQARGYSARADIASAGQSYANAVTNANNSSARAQADAAYARANANTQLYQGAASAVGDIIGVITNRKK